MVAKEVKIVNPTGLQVRPAGELCKEADKFKCKVTLRYKDGEANAKSVLSVLGACIKFGDVVELVCDGEGEEEALAHIAARVEAGLAD